jgi:hypothetical protein
LAGALAQEAQPAHLVAVHLKFTMAVAAVAQAGLVVAVGARLFMALEALLEQEEIRVLTHQQERREEMPPEALLVLAALAVTITAPIPEELAEPEAHLAVAVAAVALVPLLCHGN